MAARRSSALAASLAFALAACVGPNTPAEDARGDDAITVASFDFPESVLLAEIYAQAMEGAGIRVEREPSLGPRELVMPALLQGLVEFVPEYAGSGLQFLAGDGVDLAGSRDQPPAVRRTAGIARRDRARRVTRRGSERVRRDGGDRAAIRPPHAQRSRGGLGRPGLRRTARVHAAAALHPRSRTDVRGRVPGDPQQSRRGRTAHRLRPGGGDGGRGAPVHERRRDRSERLRAARGRPATPARRERHAGHPDRRPRPVRTVADRDRERRLGAVVHRASSER